MVDKIAHCWVDESDQYEIGTDEWNAVFSRGGGTCMLLDGHIGSHVFTPDDDIVISFIPLPVEDNLG